MTPPYPDIYWIIVDCARSYVSGKDDCDKLDIMFKMAEECADFENMMATAPSSILSACTAMSSIPASYLAGNNTDFKFESKTLWCLKDILATVGYKNYSILSARAACEKLCGVVNLVDKKFWPKETKHFQTCWPDDDVYRTLLNLLNSDPASPTFYFLWFNVGRDQNINRTIENLIQELKRRDRFEKSIFILTSDHGYPDVRRGLISDGGDLKKVGLPPELVLTDANIRVPFLLHYPGIKPCKISHTVSSEDIVPTLLDLLKVKPPAPKALPFFGNSLLPLLNGNEPRFLTKRKVRSDARSSRQSQRMTSLRSNEFKYIVNHESAAEEFYDLKKDPGETKNLALNGASKKYRAQIQSFRKEFQKGERRIIDLQITRIENEFRRYLAKPGNPLLKANSVLVIMLGSSFLYQPILKALIATRPQLRLEVFLPEDSEIPTALHKAGGRVQLFSNSNGFYPRPHSAESYDVRLEILDDRQSAIFRQMYKHFVNFKSRRTIRVDGNAQVKALWWPVLGNPKVTDCLRVLESLRETRDFYFLELNYLLHRLGRIAKLFIQNKN
ncbi:MAG TPA: sulfatase/phosphatase domain-containing protein [bacterium]